MDWVKIDWKGRYPVATAANKDAAGDYGIYAIYEVIGKGLKPLYVGETYTQKFATRLKQHNRDWLLDVEGKTVIAFGSVSLPEGRKISQETVFDIESCLIHRLKTPYNTIGKRGYCGRDLLIFNKGKRGTLDYMMSNDKELLSFIKTKA